ncbi:WhiB family transcriptional regulator [Streptomyces sp. 900116325]
MKTYIKPLLRAWAWQNEAACRGMNSSVFFSPASERGKARRRREEAARAICRDCPVSNPCGRFARASQQKYGVWGGYTERDRRSASVPPTNLDPRASVTDSAQATPRRSAGGDQRR